MDYVENVHNHKKHMEIFQFILCVSFREKYKIKKKYIKEYRELFLTFQHFAIWIMFLSLYKSNQIK